MSFRSLGSLHGKVIGKDTYKKGIQPKVSEVLILFWIFYVSENIQGTVTLVVQDLAYNPHEPLDSRAWVLQEVVLGGRNLCHLGNHEIWLHQFVDAALAVRRAGHWQDTKYKTTSMFNSETSVAIDGLIHVHQLQKMHKEGIKLPVDLSGFIPMMREASNPRDMVYSIRDVAHSPRIE